MNILEIENLCLRLEDMSNLVSNPAKKLLQLAAKQLRNDNIKLKDAYDASELVCCDLQQALNENEDRDQRHNIEATLNNAEIVRNYLLAELDFM